MIPRIPSIQRALPVVLHVVHVPEGTDEAIRLPIETGQPTDCSVLQRERLRFGSGSRVSNFFSGTV